MAALLGEGHVVDHEDPLRAGERPSHARAVAAQDLVLVPRALVDERLQGLFRIFAGQALGQQDPAGERLDALALAVEQESVQVDAGPAGRLGLGEVLGEQRGVISEAVEDSGVEFRSVGLHTRLDARIPFGDSGI